MAPDDDPQVGPARGPKGDAEDDGVDRRTFVKGAMVGAAVGAIGAGGVATAAWMLGPDAPRRGSPGDYVGAKVLVGSPTDRGVPIVHLQVDADGFLKGRADDLRPYLYCAREERWPGRDDEYPGDDHLRFHLGEHKLARVGAEEARETWWYHDLNGERIHVDHFADKPVGTGASFRWRDEDARRPLFEGVVLKIPADEIVAEGSARSVRDAAMVGDHRLIAFDAACTHFCCTAGWHEEQTARKMGLWDTIFCVCHNARFDPRQLETYDLVMKERPGV